MRTPLVSALISLAYMDGVSQFNRVLDNNYYSLKGNWMHRTVLFGAVVTIALNMIVPVFAQEYSVRDDTPVAAAPPSGFTHKAPGPAGMKKVFRNSMGTFDLRNERGTAEYQWFDGTNQQDKLKFVRYGVIDGANLTGVEQAHKGYVYKAEGADFWFFFSDTTIGAVENKPVYPLYYSFRGADRGFQRWKVNGGTTLAEK